jgi:DNA-binding transcriptional regulator YiaG
MYHYTRCGLDNVWLVNGYHVEDLGEYGQSTVVENVEQLERVIACDLVNLDRPLTGQEFRFLRVMLDLSQTAVGRFMGKDYQSVGRWEAKERRPVPRFADVAIRQRYLESIGERPMFTQIEDRLAEIASTAPIKSDLTFEEEADGNWHAKAGGARGELQPA